MIAICPSAEVVSIVISSAASISMLSEESNLMSPTLAVSSFIFPVPDLTKTPVVVVLFPMNIDLALAPVPILMSPVLVLVPIL